MMKTVMRKYDQVLIIVSQQRLQCRGGIAISSSRRTSFPPLQIVSEWLKLVHVAQYSTPSHHRAVLMEAGGTCRQTFREHAILVSCLLRTVHIHYLRQTHQSIKFPEEWGRVDILTQITVSG